MRHFAAWEMAQAVIPEHQEAPPGGRKYRIYKAGLEDMAWEVYCHHWNTILRQLISAGVVTSGWREREVKPEELPVSYQDGGDLLCW